MVRRNIGFGRALGALALVAFAARLAFVLWVGNTAGYTGGDQSTYLRLAHHYATADGYPTTIRVPGYPAFLSILFTARDLVGSHSNDRAVLGFGQALLGTTTVVLTGLLGRRLHRGSTGLVAAALVAVWPSLIVMTSVALSETLFTTLFVASLAVLFWREEASPRQAAAAGLLLGCAYLVRFVAIAPLLVTAVWFLRCHGRRAWPWLWRLVLGAGLVMVPWAWRNLETTGAFVPADTSGGYSWCMGNHDGAHPDDASYPDCSTWLPGESEVQFDRRVTRRAMTWIAHHPAAFAGMVPERAGYLVATDDDGISELNGRDPATQRWTSDQVDDLRSLLNGWWRAWRWPALGGLVLMAATRRTRWLVIVSLSAVAPPLLAAVAPRYHLPLVPVLAIAIAIAADRSLRWATGELRSWRAARSALRT